MVGKNMISLHGLVQWTLKFAGVLAVLCSLLIPSTWLAACPFCSAPSMTLAEQLNSSDAFVIATYTKGEKPLPEEQGIGKAFYTIKEVIKTPKGRMLEVDEKVEIEGYREGTPGDLVSITGTEGSVIAWGSPTAMTPAALEYMKHTPSREVPIEKRLPYFIKFLGSTDNIIEDDAYAEFAIAPFNDVVKVADQLPREMISHWVFSPDTKVTRLGLYGLLLGLCGNENDKALLKAKITENSSEYRLGIDGMMAGYLYLTGPEGLEVIEESKLRPKATDGNAVQLNEVYSALSAIRFMYEYGHGKISHDRLKKSMRILLEHENLCDLAILDLARWKDWEVSDELIALYAKTPDNNRRLKRAIAGFFVVCELDKPGDAHKPEDADKPVEALPDPPHVVKAKTFLEQLEQTEPKIVEYARKTN
jgi:hypothetical protein